MKKWATLALMLAIIAVDQWIKNWAISILYPVGQIEVIPGFFNLTYVENRGAALGMFQGKVMLLALISGVLLLFLTVLLFLGKYKSSFLDWTICVGIAGGFGNLYDRLLHNFVVDYLDFSPFIKFPWVFNFADCCVVVATVLILIYFIKQDIGAKKAQELKSKEA